MIKSKSQLLALISTVILIACQSNNSETLVKKWDWLPESISDTMLFAPGIISDTGRYEQSVSFSPDGSVAYFSVHAGRKAGRNFWIIMQSKYINGQWQLPDTCSFSGQFSDYGPFLSPDGSTLYFSSRRPVNEGDTTLKNEYDIWKVSVSGNEFGKPKRLADGINTNMEEYSIAAGKNNLYICARRNDSLDRSDIFTVPVSEEDNLFASIKNLGDKVNNEMWEGQPYVNADETMLFFSHAGEGEGANEDIYVCTKDNGNWSKPKKLNGIVNTTQNEFMHFVTPDGKYLFFGRNKNILIVKIENAIK